MKQSEVVKSFGQDKDMGLNIYSDIIIMVEEIQNPVSISIGDLPNWKCSPDARQSCAVQTGLGLNVVTDTGMSGLRVCTGIGKPINSGVDKWLKDIYLLAYKFVFTSLPLRYKLLYIGDSTPLSQEKGIIPKKIKIKNKK